MRDRGGPQRIWTVRHGQTADALEREETERSGELLLKLKWRDADVPLSELGHKQAYAVGKWFAQLPAKELPTVVLSSPYLRAVQTAQEILAGAKLQLPLVCNERLREREFGSWEPYTQKGMEMFDHIEWMNRQRIGKFYHRSPNGENWCDVLLRLRDLERDIVSEFVGENVLVVCHHTVVQCTRVMREGLSEQEILAIRQVPNCSITAHVLDPDVGPMRRYRLDYAYKVIPVDESDNYAPEQDSER